MTINSHITVFHDRAVVNYLPSHPYAEEKGFDPGHIAWRIEDTEYDGGEIFAQRLAAFLAEPWAEKVTTVIIGNWGSVYDNAPPIEALIDAAPHLPSLRAFFLAELTYEESEISWICHGDITALLKAYPQLEVFTIRGSQGLSLSPLRHESLRKLTFESGGLPAEVVQAVDSCDLPSLTHLELWLGTEEYGGTATCDDIRHILAGTRLPCLTYLGLRDAEIADAVALALVSAPIVARLETLDLSLGILSDAGISAMLAGQSLTHLNFLDLHHHYLTKPMMQRLTAELGDAGVSLDLSEAEDPTSDDRYVEVSE